MNVNENTPIEEKSKEIQALAPKAIRVETGFFEQLETHEKDVDEIKRRLEEPEFTRLISVAIERIFFGANERKIKRFAAVIV